MDLKKKKNCSTIVLLSFESKLTIAAHSILIRLADNKTDLVTLQK